MPEPCRFPSLDSCQKRFLWTHKGVDLAMHPAVRLVLQGDVEEFPQAWILFSSEQQAGSMFTAIEEGGGDKRLVELELACKADGVAPPDPV